MVVWLKRGLGLALLLLALWGMDTAATNYLEPTYYTLLVNIGRFVILAVSLNLINGITGQFSLGHMAFFALGGYAAAVVTKMVGHRLFGPVPSVSEGIPAFWYAWFAGSLLFGGLVAAVVGLAVGLPTLRLRGDYLAIVTLGMGEIVNIVIQNQEWIGGALGFADLPLFVRPGTGIFWIYLVAVATVLAIRNITQTTHGRALMAIREDEVAAQAMGVNVVRYKVLAFMVGAFFAGIAGGLYAHQQGIITPRDASFVRSIEIVVMVALGGSGSITGSILAAAILTALPEFLREAVGRLPYEQQEGARQLIEQLQMVIYALLLIVLMLVRPQGLLGARELSLRNLLRRRKPRSAPEPSG
ncbi:MAG: branched-chain amino acid ABC transporter permease [Armatimonadetes bacterium]|nr:branched-chain amino acid ABC transporter permease [Armatimonadota bacterium]